MLPQIATGGFSAISRAICKAAANPATPLNTALVTDTAYEVANTLAGNSSIDVNLSCDTLDNPFLNKVEARSKTSASLSAPDLIRTYEIVSDDDVADECEAPTTAAIDVTKDCVGDKVTLVNGSGGMKAHACFSIEVTNKGTVQLKDLVVTDPKLKSGNLVATGTTLGPAGTLASLVAHASQPVSHSAASRVLRRSA